MTNTRNNKQKKRLMTRKNNKKQQGGLVGFEILLIIISIVFALYLSCNLFGKCINVGGSNIFKDINSRFKNKIDFNKLPQDNGYTIVNKNDEYIFESNSFKLYENNKTSYHNIHYILYPVDNSKRDQVDLAFTLTIILNILLNNVKDNYYLTKCSNIIKKISDNVIKDVIRKHSGTIMTLLNINQEDFYKINDNLPEEIKKILDYINWLNENIITDATNCDKKGEKYLKKFMSRLNGYKNYIKYNANPNPNEN